MFNKVICIGDSYTNEHRHYENNNIDFKQLGYEFKSYPQLLGEHYGCDWETFGRPGMPMPYSLQILIDKIDYIQSFDNPLVIYQFGFFDNLILSTSGGDYVEWKDIAAETMGAPSNNNSEVLPNSRHQVINHNLNFFENIQMSKLEAVGMMTFLEKFGDLTNYHLIEQFLSIAKLLKRSNIDIYGVFFSHSKNIQVPKHNNILHLGKRGFGLDLVDERLDNIFPQFNDTHKTTKGNQAIADEIINILLKKLDKAAWHRKNPPIVDNLI